MRKIISFINQLINSFSNEIKLVELFENITKIARSNL